MGTGPDAVPPQRGPDSPITRPAPPARPEVRAAAAAPPDLPLTATLDLPTGKLIAGDPATLYADALPIATTLPRGTFPVRWTPGLIRVEFAAEPPTAWVNHPGFRTGSGHGCLLDADALADFTDLGDEPVDEYELLAERFGQPPSQSQSPSPSQSSTPTPLASPSASSSASPSESASVLPSRPGLVPFCGLIAFAAPGGAGAVRVGYAGRRIVRLDCEIIAESAH